MEQKSGRDLKVQLLLKQINYNGCINRVKVNLKPTELNYNYLCGSPRLWLDIGIDGRICLIGRMERVANVQELLGGSGGMALL